jgi:hypothetical protein
MLRRIFTSKNSELKDHIKPQKVFKNMQNLRKCKGTHVFSFAFEEAVKQHGI